MNEELLKKMGRTLQIQEEFIEAIKYYGPSNDTEIDKFISEHKEIKKWFEKIVAEKQESAYENPDAEIMTW